MLEIILSCLYIDLMYYLGCRLPIKNTEIKRKLAHVLVSLWWLIIALFSSYSDCLLLVPIIAFLLVIIISNQNKQLTLDRNDSIKEYGVPLFFIGMFGLLLIIKCSGIDLKTGVVFAIPLIFGDSAAAICGKKYGHKHLWGWFKSKTIAGSCAMLVASMVSLLLYRGFVGCNYNLFDLIIISILATVFEMVSIKGIDNLTIPCATAILYLILKG